MCPTYPLSKQDLRSLLTHLIRPHSSELSLSAEALQGAREWAIAAHLVDEQGLTNEGMLVATKDPYLETTVTDWVIHLHLSLSDDRLWKYFIHGFLPNHSIFTQNELLNSCSIMFTKDTQDELERSIRLFLKTYIDAKSIAKHQLLKKEKILTQQDIQISLSLNKPLIGKRF